MTFSERMGLKTPKKIQLTSIDPDLRMGLWNVFHIHCFQELVNAQLNSNFVKDHRYLHEYVTKLWSDFFNIAVDDMPRYVHDASKDIRDRHKVMAWNRVYDFVEFNISFLGNIVDDMTEQQFVQNINTVLQREFSGFRIVGKIVSPITNEIECQTIEKGIFNGAYRNVSIHLNTALEKLSDKLNPDYRNSIKESISAIETLCREMTGENTLGAALRNFELRGFIFNSQFKEALEKLYAYTNSKQTGIRHSLLDQSQLPSFEEAEFMLVSCSAFINYLLQKNLKTTDNAATT